MTESINLAPAIYAVLHGGAMPEDLVALALLTTAGVLIALVADWFRTNQRNAIDYARPFPSQAD
jgi:hypothetical protein